MYNILYVLYNINSSKLEFDEDDDIPLTTLQEENDIKEEREIKEEKEQFKITDSDSNSGDSYNNADRLWCICQQPHNNRFFY